MLYLVIKFLHVIGAAVFLGTGTGIAFFMLMAHLKLWLHEVKHDGFRVIARKTGKRVKLYSRPGNDLTYRFPVIVAAMAGLHLRSCIIDVALACAEDGLSSFDRIRYVLH
jgi:ATP-dependent DNA ligase